MKICNVCKYNKTCAAATSHTAASCDGFAADGAELTILNHCTLDWVWENLYECSNCSRRIRINKNSFDEDFKYCPYCGAKIKDK